MLHPDREHFLQVEVARLRAENERLETAARAYIEGHELALTRAEKAEAECEVNSQLHAATALDLVEAQEALAAARRECEGLRGLNGRCRVMVPTHIIEGRDYESQMCCNPLPCALHPEALAAPAAAADKPYPEPRCTCHARHDGKHAQACELWNTTGDL